MKLIIILGIIFFTILIVVGAYNHYMLIKNK